MEKNILPQEERNEDKKKTMSNSSSFLMKFREYQESVINYNALLLPGFFVSLLEGPMNVRTP